MFQFKETRLVVVFCTFKERHRAGVAADKTGLGVDAELVACIDDVEVAHGQLADTVGSCEHGVALFHCQAFRFVCQVGRTCIEDRVVIAAAKFDIDFTGDCTSNPALSGFAEHDG